MQTSRIVDADRGIAVSIRMLHPQRVDRENLIDTESLTDDMLADVDFFENYYDEIWIPDELHGVHYKAAITKRNEWFVNNSNMLIAYVVRDNGGAFACLQKARKAELITVNLGEQKEKTHD